VNDELRPADDVISGSRSLQILMGGFDADGENCRNLPVGLPLSNEPEALDLAPAEPWPRSVRRWTLPKPA
jgi:hypothetical protein